MQNDCNFCVRRNIMNSQERELVAGSVSKVYELQADAG